MLCAKCRLKHLTTAYGLLQEGMSGYPTHSWLALGQLVLAEWEGGGEKIREVRLIYEQLIISGEIIDLGLLISVIEEAITLIPKNGQTY